jgi:hypothetical protein
MARVSRCNTRSSWRINSVASQVAKRLALRDSLTVAMHPLRTLDQISSRMSIRRNAPKSSVVFAAADAGGKYISLLSRTCG